MKFSKCAIFFCRLLNYIPRAFQIKSYRFVSPSPQTILGKPYVSLNSAIFYFVMNVFFLYGFYGSNTYQNGRTDRANFVVWSYKLHDPPVFGYRRFPIICLNLLQWKLSMFFLQGYSQRMKRLYVSLYSWFSVLINFILSL